MIKNTLQSYGTIAKLLHWAIAILIIGLFCMGLYMADLEASPDKGEIYQWHKSFGITVLALVLLRLLWRGFNVQPPLPNDLAVWQKTSSHATHWVLYALMLAVPFAGWMMSNYAGRPVSPFGLWTIPSFVEADKEWLDVFKEWHETLAWVLIALVGLHAAAGLYHHFVRKDDVLRRMV